MKVSGRTVPPVVYVPCRDITMQAGGVAVDTRRSRDGSTALLVYTALDRLVACCGEEQPWVLLPTANLDSVGVPIDMILFDVDIPMQERRREPAS